MLGLALAAAPACHPGGAYVQAQREGGADRGETNGRMFDFVSNKPDGDQWTIRIRGSSMYAAYSLGKKSDDLGSVNLTDKETRKVWKLIDALELPTRKKGKEDPDEGFVQLQLREPGESGEDAHDIYKAYVSRETKDEDVIEIAGYLEDLIAKYHKEKPNF